MIVAIQQPEHLPWIGFFNKMIHCDRFVILDSVQFKKRYFENRNRIRAADGFRWVTVPVHSKGRYTQRIRDVEIDNSTAWAGSYWRAIQHAYARTRFFKRYAPRFEGILERRWVRLLDLNLALIEQARQILNVRTPLVKASDVTRAEISGSDLLLTLCRALGATKYVSGPDGRSYLDTRSFDDAGVEISYHDFDHPTYDQSAQPFVSHLSIVDLIFNEGPESGRVVSGSHPPA